MLRKLSKEHTRKEMIDPQLEKVSRFLRDHSKVKIEIPAFKPNIYENYYYADLIRFLHALQSVFLQKRHLETVDLYEPPLDMFGTDAVERWFTEREVQEVVEFANQMSLH